VDDRVVWDGRATGVVIANGEYLRGLDVVPRGHPGDGRLEVHVHALGATQRRQMRARLATGTHLPHPGVRTACGTTVAIRWNHPARREVDGVRTSPTRETVVSLAPGALTIVP
jgi:diacylglycerol kinase family enzyme